MKIESGHVSGFKPKTFSVTVESAQDLKDFYRIINLAYWYLSTNVVRFDDEAAEAAAFKLRQLIIDHGKENGIELK